MTPRPSSDSIDADVPRLDFFYYDGVPGKELGRAWGQLMGGAHRLWEVHEVLQGTSRIRDIRARLRRLAFAVESYLVRVYELRDRTLTLLALITGDERTTSRLRHPNSREQAFRQLEAAAPVVVQSVRDFFTLVDDDVLLRNRHTHDQFLSVGLYTGDNIYDPEDALMDLEDNEAARTALTKILRQQIGRLRDRYSDRVQAVYRAAVSIAEATNPYLKR